MSAGWWGWDKTFFQVFVFSSLFFSSLFFFCYFFLVFRVSDSFHAYPKKTCPILFGICVQCRRFPPGSDLYLPQTTRSGL